MTGESVANMPPRFRMEAGCKVNLWLRITGVRDDGYHEIDSLYWPLREPYDTLEMAPLPEPGLRMASTSAEVDVHDNSLLKAYTVYIKANPLSFGLAVALKKRIPIGAGLGGGSSDAAAVLTYLNTHAPTPLSAEELTQVALQVGADVPFFLHNVPCHVRGIGEIIEPVAHEKLQGLYLLLLCPRIHVPTPWAYAQYDTLEKNKNPSERLTTSNEQDKHSFSEVTQYANDLEEAVFAAHPKLVTLKTKLLQSNALVALMSGSGSSMIGLYPDAKSAFKAAESFGKFGMRVFTTVL